MKKSIQKNPSKSVVYLLLLVLVMSIVGTWVVLDKMSEVELTYGEDNTKQGTVKIHVIGKSREAKMADFGEVKVSVIDSK